MVARPGTSLHRNGTELDLGPPSACGWLARRADDIGFVKRYSREPWHHGCAAWLDVLQPLVMKLYVCWGTFPVPWPRSGETWRPRGHPCMKAHDALKDAGHSPDVEKVYGLASCPTSHPGVRRSSG